MSAAEAETPTAREKDEGQGTKSVEDLRELIEELRRDNEELRKENRELKMKAEDQVEEEYPGEELNIRVTVTHDEDSREEELKRENEELREQIRELEQGEEIPFLDFVEEKKLSEKKLDGAEEQEKKDVQDEK